MGVISVTTNKLTPLAKNLRKNSTDAERLLWKHLRAKQLNGVKFRRQQPIGDYIVDFISLEKRLIIELDGGQHLENRDDKIRDEFLKSQGFTVIRFWNNDVLNNINGVLEMILSSFNAPSHNPSSPIGGQASREGK